VKIVLWIVAALVCGRLHLGLHARAVPAPRRPATGLARRAPRAVAAGVGGAAGGVAVVEPLGWFVIDGHKVPIVAVELRDGKVHFVGSADGPLPAASGWITVVGQDGQGICQGDEVVSWEQVRRDETLSLVLPVSIDWLHTPTARPA